MIDYNVKNIYPGEQEKLDDNEKTELMLSLKMGALLRDYGYTMEAVLEDGLPEIKFVKV